MQRSITVGLGLAVLVAIAFVLIPRSWLMGPDTYSVRGRVVGFGETPSTVIIEHEEIGAHMPAMTMPFTVADPSDTEGLEIGDPVEFQYHVQVDSTWVTDLRTIPEDSVSAHPASD